MGRTIGENIRNKVTINDQYSGDPLILYYRSPTAEERIAYRASMYQREKDKVIFRLGEARQEFGAKIVLGFEEGSFQIKEGDKLRVFSSEPASANYDAGWKDLLKKYAADVLEALAEHAFEEARAIPSQEDYTEKN